MTGQDAPHTHLPWEAMAGSYAVKADRLEPELRVVTEAMLNAAHAGVGLRLLDLGCGPGHSTAAAAARGAHALGIDTSSAMIDLAKRRHPGARFLVGNMVDPPSGPWDAVVCRFAAHHADPSWVDATYRVLREGGRLAIAEVVPPGHAPHAHAEGKVGPASWRERFERAGFDDVRTQACILPVGLAWPPTWIISGRKPQEAPR